MTRPSDRPRPHPTMFALEMVRTSSGCTVGSASKSRTCFNCSWRPPVVLWAGWPFFERGWASLKSRNLNMFTLIAIGTGVAGSTAWPPLWRPPAFPPSMRTPAGAVPVYFEAAAVITVLVLLGQVLELRAREQTSGAIRSLLDLSPKTARRIGPDGSDHDIGLDTSWSAIVCASVPANAFPSMAKSSKAAARSTSRW